MQTKYGAICVDNGDLYGTWNMESANMWHTIWKYGTWNMDYGNMESSWGKGRGAMLAIAKEGWIKSRGLLKGQPGRLKLILGKLGNMNMGGVQVVKQMVAGPVK